MYLDYKELGSAPSQPMLRLRTLAGTELGPIPFVYDLRFEINYADLSTIEFTIPYMVDGKINPLYNEVKSYRVVYTDNFGIYVLVSPQKSGDGISETKHVQGYSLERLFQNKSLYLQEGTYNFWNPVDQTDSILSRILELDPTWKVGYVAPRLIGCYRTFDEYDSDALGFCYTDAAEKYHCAFVFDVYGKTINVYDTNEDVERLPIYLSYQNLVDTVGVDEIMDEFATKLHVYGSDDLSIRDVNPTGTDYIVNLDYFMENGDLNVRVGGSTETLAERVVSWQNAIKAKQTYYTGLVSIRASLTAQRMSAQAALTDLKGELDSLLSQQSLYIQAIAMETTDEGRDIQQKKLDSINKQITEKRAEILHKESEDKESGKEAEIKKLTDEIEEYAAKIKAITDELSYSNYFTAEERNILNSFLIDGDVVEETFVATDVDASVSGARSTVSGTVSVKEAKIAQIDVEDAQKSMYVIQGGKIHIDGVEPIDAAIVRGTLETKGGDYVLTGYLGNTTYGKRTFPSGLVTLSGAMTGFTKDVTEKVVDGITEKTGSKFEFTTDEASLYFTVNVSEYQKYSVAMELYDFGAEALGDYAYPTYEFNIDSANFLYQKEFEPFKDSLELGKAIYLQLGSEGLLTAKIIGFELDFENISNFNLVFSNRFQRKDGVKRLKDNLYSSSRTSRSFDASKYIYNRAAAKTTQVDEFMRGQLNAAVNNIVNKEDQSVTISGAGIQIGGDSNYQIRIVDNMIAMTDDGWQTSKLAIGLFATEQGKYWGVNADVIMGKLLAGSNLVLENVTKDGVMQFKADASGVWLNNSVFVLQSDGGGKMMIHPDYGFAAGTKDLFTVENEEVKPIFINENGELVTDNDDFPKNANFYIDPKTGNAYFRGTVYATDGEFEGVVKADDFYLNDGSGKMSSILNDAKDKITADWLDLYGINVKNNAGTTVLRIDDDGIRFAGSGNCQFAKTNSTDDKDWHYPMASDDEYRRDFVRFGEKDAIVWGTPYKIVAKDGATGRPGSDANVPQWVKDMTATYIDNEWVISPNIYGGKITSGTTIDVTTDLHVGHNVYIGNDNGKKQLWFDGGTVITKPDGADALTLSTMGVFEINALRLDLSGITDRIIWGKHAPTAVFG